jgi:hypothetical protein
MVLIDPSDSARRFFNFGAANGASLAQLPHVLSMVTNGRELDDLILRLMAEYDETAIARLRQETNLVYAPVDNARRSIVLLIDHADDLEMLNKGGKRGGIAALAEIGKGKNLHIVLSGSLELMRSGATEIRRRVESARHSLVLQDLDTVRFMGARGPFTTKEMPTGRGYLVRGLGATLTQIAMPALDARDGRDSDAVLGDRIDAIMRRHGDGERARWSYFERDLTDLVNALYGKGAGQASAANADGAAEADGETPANETVSYDGKYDLTQAETDIDFGDLDNLLADMSVGAPTELSFAKLELSEDDQKFHEEKDAERDARAKAASEARGTGESA